MNRKEIKKDEERNRAQRLEFVTWHARWVKSTPNAIWSRQQREMIDGIVIAANRARMERTNNNESTVA